MFPWRDCNLRSAARRLLQITRGFFLLRVRSTSKNNVLGASWTAHVLVATSEQWIRHPFSLSAALWSASHQRGSSPSPQKSSFTSAAENKNWLKLTWSSMVSDARSLAAFRKASVSVTFWNSTSQHKDTNGIFLRSPKPRNLQSPEVFQAPAGCRQEPSLPNGLHSSTSVFTAREAAASSSTEVSDEKSSARTKSSLLRLSRHGMALRCLGLIKCTWSEITTCLSSIYISHVPRPICAESNATEGKPHGCIMRSAERKW